MAGPDGELRWQRPAPFNAWKVIVQGVSIPRHGRGGTARTPRFATVLVVIIDDEKGAFHAAVVISE